MSWWSDQKDKITAKKDEFFSSDKGKAFAVLNPVTTISMYTPESLFTPLENLDEAINPEFVSPADPAVATPEIQKSKIETDKAFRKIMPGLQTQSMLNPITNSLGK